MNSDQNPALILEYSEDELEDLLTLFNRALGCCEPANQPAWALKQCDMIERAVMRMRKKDPR